MTPAARAVLDAVREDRLTAELQREYRRECAQAKEESMGETLTDAEIEALLREATPGDPGRTAADARHTLAVAAPALASEVLRLRGLWRKAAPVLAEALALYRSGYDGPFMGEEVEALLAALLDEARKAAP